MHIFLFLFFVCGTQRCSAVLPRDREKIKKQTKRESVYSAALCVISEGRGEMCAPATVKVCSVGEREGWR